MIKLIQALLAVSLISSPAIGQVIAGIAFNYEEESAKNNTTDAEVQVTRQTFNLGVGYRFTSGVFTGAKYYQKNTISDTSVTIAGVTTTTTSKELTTGMGVTLGYYADNGFLIQGSYILEPQRESSSTDYYGGDGIMADIAYRFAMGDFAFGPQLTYTSFTYKKEKSAGVESDVDFTQTHMLPMLAAWMTF